MREDYVEEALVMKEIMKEIRGSSCRFKFAEISQTNVPEQVYYQAVRRNVNIRVNIDNYLAQILKSHNVFRKRCVETIG